jgi:hypothetical protein
VVTDPDRLEPHLFGGARYGEVFRPGYVSLDLGKLYADAQRFSHGVMLAELMK